MKAANMHYLLLNIVPLSNVWLGNHIIYRNVLQVYRTLHKCNYDPKIKQLIQYARCDYEYPLCERQISCNS